MNEDDRDEILGLLRSLHSAAMFVNAEAYHREPELQSLAGLAAQTARDVEVRLRRMWGMR